MPNEDDRRTVFGIAPKLLFFTALFSFPVILFAYLTHPRYVVRSTRRTPLRIAGAIMTSVGFVFYVVSAEAVLKAFKQNKLMTTGVFGICRHPMYGSVIIAIIPGVSLLFGMPLLLLIPVIMYLTFRFKLMKSEEKPLREIFGEEYLKYRADVNAVFPTIHRKGSRIPASGGAHGK